MNEIQTAEYNSNKAFEILWKLLYLLKSKGIKS